MQVGLLRSDYIHLKAGSTSLGLMVVLPLVCAATKLARSATATVDLANMMRDGCLFGRVRNWQVTQLMFLRKGEDVEVGSRKLFGVGEREGVD